MKKRGAPNQATSASPLDNPVVKTELRRAPEAIHVLPNDATLIPPGRRPRLDFGDVIFDIARPGDQSVTTLNGVARMAKQNGSLGEEAARQMAPRLPPRRTQSHDPGAQLQEEISSRMSAHRKRKRTQWVDGEEISVEKLIHMDDRGIDKTNTESNDLDVTNSKTTAAIQATRQMTPVYKLLSQMLVCEEAAKEAHPDKLMCLARTSPVRILRREADANVRYF